MTTALGFILVIVVLIGGAYYASRLLMKRAVRQVVRIFRKHGATSTKTATTLDQMGLGPTRYFERMFRTRDYKPYALRLLAQADIVRTTEEGRVYLSEAELDRSPLKRFARIKSEAQD